MYKWGMVSRLGHKILVVEDDIDMLGIYESMLVKEGFEVWKARSGTEALDGLRAVSPDVVLLDVKLPWKNGDEVLLEMKMREDWARIPVVVASNADDHELVSRMLDLGAKTYFVKSKVSVNEIVDSCRECVKYVN